jgi:hypothetical protein
MIWCIVRSGRWMAYASQHHTGMRNCRYIQRDRWWRVHASIDLASACAYENFTWTVWFSSFEMLFPRQQQVLLLFRMRLWKYYTDGLVLKLRNALPKAAAGPPALSNATGLDGYLQCSSPVRGEFIIAWTDIAG